MKAAWLARLPAGLFAIPVGFFGLAGAWRRAVGYGWHMAEDISSVLLMSTVLLWGVLLALYAAKCIAHPQAVRAEFSHPVQGSLLALLLNGRLLPAG